MVSPPLPESARRHLLKIYDTALHAVNGRDRVAAELQSRGLSEPVYLIAIGKAACAMAQGAHEILGSKIVRGLVITKVGYGEPLPWPVLEADHPIPGQSSVDAAITLLAYIDDIPRGARVLALISGGASALVELPVGSVTLSDLSRITEWLLASGLDIMAANRVRKNLSRIKQGRLAERLAPRKVTALYISDVPDDDPATIGSGLLAPDIRASQTADLTLPDFIITAMQHAGSPPAPDDPCFAGVEHCIVASLDQALQAAELAATQLGYQVLRHHQRLAGDARDCGARLARQLVEADSYGVVHLWGGENTVMLPAVPGRGGRCQTLALSAARILADNGPGLLLAGATDGSDGPGADAGALVDHLTVSRGQVAGLDAESCLDRADAGAFLEATGDLLVTGPTGTNVTDIVMGLRRVQG